MRIHSLLLGGIALGGQALAFSGREVEGGLRSVLRRGLAESHLEEQAHQILYGRDLVQRQAPSSSAAPPPPTQTPQSGDASAIDLQAWNEQTEASCQSRMKSMNGPSNPSSMSVCYNLPFLDNSTGVFQAELRLYRLASPIDPWVGVEPAFISMTLSYVGAMVASLDGQQAPVGKRSVDLMDELVLHPFEHHALVVRQDRPDFPRLKIISYVGKINDNLMGSAMNNDQLQDLLVPTITLSAFNPVSRLNVSTTLSSVEASFINGVFSEASTNTTSEVTAASASAAAATAVPVAVPGLTFGIFPIGFIVTMAWTALFCATVGFGAFRKVQFREQFRRRKNREKAMWTAQQSF